MRYRMATLCTLAILLFSGCGVFKKAVPLEKTLAGALIDANGNRIATGDLLDTDYLLLYFSAHWCPPCQVFTPKLVEFYRSHGGGQLFHTLLVSSDHSETAMFDYMRETHMPWPAIQYSSPAINALNRTYSGDGIPRLVLINNKGDVLADSFKGSEYLGPQTVLEKLKDLLAERKTDPVGISEATGKLLPTPNTLAKKFKINGFGQGSQNDIAIINGQFTAVGAELDKGVRVEKITTTFVEISYEGNHYRLYP